MYGLIYHLYVSKSVIHAMDKKVEDICMTYPTMRPISTSPLLRRLIYLDMFDDQIAGVETLGIGVGFCIFEESKKELGGLLGPASFRHAELFSCNTSVNPAFLLVSTLP